MLDRIVILEHIKTIFNVVEHNMCIINLPASELHHNIKLMLSKNSVNC